jgi:hypothetical protein
VEYLGEGKPNASSLWNKNLPRLVEQPIDLSSYRRRNQTCDSFDFPTLGGFALFLAKHVGWGIISSHIEIKAISQFSAAHSDSHDQFIDRIARPGDKSDETTAHAS